MTVKINTNEVAAVMNELWGLEDEVAVCKRRATVLSTCVLLSEKAHEDAKNLYKEICDSDKPRVKATQKGLSQCKETKDVKLMIDQIREQYINCFRDRLNVIEFSFAEIGN